MPNTKPVAAAASPEYAFSSATTTGMSAPPMGATSSTPSTSDSTASAPSATANQPTAGYTAAAHPAAAIITSVASPTTIEARRMPGNAPGPRPRSLATATNEPDSVTVPISTEAATIRPGTTPNVEAAWAATSPASVTTRPG